MAIVHGGGKPEEPAPAPDVAPAPRRRFHQDPWSVAGLLLAAAALSAFAFFYVRRPTLRVGDEVARLTALVGQVKRRPAAQEAWTPARLAERLRVGDLVQTESAAAAEISFDSGNVVRVRPASVVHVGGSAESSTAAWRVQRGHIQFDVGAQATEIVTPTARTTAESHSAGNIDVSEAGATGVRVFRGSARILTSLEQRITLSANEAVQVDAAGKAGAKQALPPPPTPLLPAAQARVPAGPATRFSWTAVPGGVRYRLAVDYNVVQANLLLATALDAPGLADTTHELPGLETGRYFWRVAAVNDAGLEGAFSRTAFFAIVPAGVPERAASGAGEAPPLALEPIEEVSPGVLLVAGRTDPRAAVSVNGAPLRVLSDGSFSEYVRHADGRELVVRATSPRGAFSEETRPVPVR